MIHAGAHPVARCATIELMLMRFSHYLQMDIFQCLSLERNDVQSQPARRPWPGRKTAA